MTAPRYRVVNRSYSRGDLFEIETVDVYEVVDEHGAVIRRYDGASSGSLARDGSGWDYDGGGSSLFVELTPDGGAVRVVRGNTVTIEPLP